MPRQEWSGACPALAQAFVYCHGKPGEAMVIKMQGAGPRDLAEFAASLEMMFAHMGGPFLVTVFPQGVAARWGVAAWSQALANGGPLSEDSLAALVRAGGVR